MKNLYLKMQPLTLTNLIALYQIKPFICRRKFHATHVKYLVLKAFSILHALLNKPFSQEVGT